MFTKQILDNTFEYACYGDTPRETVINESLEDVKEGHVIAHTIKMICVELKLIEYGHKGKLELTDLGHEYLQWYQNKQLVDVE